MAGLGLVVLFPRVLGVQMNDNPKYQQILLLSKEFLSPLLSCFKVCVQFQESAVATQLSNQEQLTLKHPNHNSHP